jgi:hypothetical protein
MRSDEGVRESERKERVGDRLSVLTEMEVKGKSSSNREGA